MGEGKGDATDPGVPVGATDGVPTGAATGPEVGPRDRWGALSEATVRAAGLLPLRLFLGVTYLYAGVDKFSNPHFFTAGDPFSVAGQMAGYARTSPLAPLIDASMPAAIQIGFLIALAELAVGLGVLTGLSFRLAAASGAAISLLFWLTASWSSTPYFFSPDLPYAFGFLALALVGHGGLLVVDPARGRGMREGTVVTGPEVIGGPVSPGRRSVLQVGLLAALTLVAAGVAASLRALGSAAQTGGGAAGAAATRAPATATTAPATPAPTPAEPAASTAARPATSLDPAPTAPAATPAPSAAAATSPSGPVIGSLADFDTRNGIPFTVPFEVPGNLNPGGPAIMVRLADGTVVAYGAVCTHGRCTVGWDETTSIIQCPCHTARFDPANQAAVLGGPAPSPLPSIPVAVDATGQIHVTAVR